MSYPRINTIEELEWRYYSQAGQRYLNQADKFTTIRKDADVTTGITGVFNVVYGAQVWAQFNQEANIFGALPKYAWDQDGWRVITAAAGSAADGGTSENGAIPATIKPTFAQVSTAVKTVAHSFGVSELHEFQSEISDNDAFGSMAQMRSIMAVKHKEAINEQLARDVDSTADTRIESIDRVCSSYTEVTENSLTANDADIYGLDRDTSTGWYHAYFDGNSGNDRNLTDGLIRDAFDNIQEAGGNISLILTGHDTYSAIQGLYDPQVRYANVGETKMQMSVNGVQTAEGVGVGLNIPTLYGVPMIVSSDVQKDTISRMYFLDTTDPEGFGKPRLGMKIAKPTQYFEAGINQGDPFGINRFGNEGVYRTMGELICYNFKAQGKIRDLK